MNVRSGCRPALILLLVALFTTTAARAWEFFPGPAPRHLSPRELRQSVVKIYVTIQREDYAQPWQARGVVGASGSGFVINKRRILTNAHIVSDARFIEVQREGDPQKYPAQVAFAGHDCDLAILTVSDPKFFENTQPLVLGRDLPDLNDQVVVVGYPMGGTRISFTQGVVSRIDYSLYTHSSVDTHLVLQVDAAINPGNSGGPVMFAGKVVGVAFQAIMDAQNIGYAIPLPVIRHFLDDVEDGVVHGYPEFGVAYMDTRNPALRKDLELTEKETGVVVYYVDPFGSAVSNLVPGDVLLDIDGHTVADDGSIQLDGNPVEFTELLERKQWGETIDCSVWRKGTRMQLTIPLRNPQDPFAFRSLYDRRPEYLITQGMVFSPLTRNYLGTLGNDWNNPSIQSLLYYSQYAKVDGYYTNRSQFVVLIGRLAHPVNTYSHPFVYRVVTEANHRAIGSLRDLSEALRHPVDGFHVITFEGMDDPLILNANAAEQADREIMSRYNIQSLVHCQEPPP